MLPELPRLLDAIHAQFRRRVVTVSGHHLVPYLVKDAIYTELYRYVMAEATEAPEDVAVTEQRAEELLVWLVRNAPSYGLRFGDRQLATFAMADEGHWRFVAIGIGMQVLEPVLFAEYPEDSDEQQRRRSTDVRELSKESATT